MRLGAAAMAVLLLAAAAVQLNDPDPVQWVLVYALGAVASGLAAARRCPEWLVALAFATFLVWGLSMVPAVLQFRTESVTEMSLGRVVDEEAREGVGLLIGAGWCGVLWWWVRHSRIRSANDTALSEPTT